MNQLDEYRKGKKNLILALCISIPGLAALAIGMLNGASATETADLVRRSCELLSILLTYIVFEATALGRFGNAERRKALEHSVSLFSAQPCASAAQS